MKYLFALISVLTVNNCLAQDLPNIKLAASYFKEAELASKGQKLWKAEIYGPTLLVEPKSRVVYANVQDDLGILKPAGGIFSGILPKEVMIANTAINWEGKKWSVMLLPLPQQRDERVSLMIHESFHRVQQGLGFFDKSPTADHLANLQGRIYFLLELQALRAALLKSVPMRVKDLENALAFRQRRAILFPATFANESILEISEGLAEFTGLMLGRNPRHIRQHLLDQIDSASNLKSLIRSSAYLTGPVYGYLLYGKDPQWTNQLSSTTTFPALIKKTYHFKLPINMSASKLFMAKARYNGQSIEQAETEKDRQRSLIEKTYINIYTQNPVLTIKLVKMEIQFNPNNLFDLGNLGTVYPTAQIKDSWGTLTVAKGSMLMKDWQVVHLPMNGTEPATTGNKISGDGWQMDLKEGWKIQKIDSLHYQLTQ
ncbi:hypothetical protein WG904_19305 [Pedobacter sp. Du54]|uniref:hypothetical protein n=1 Tax=Pedobacter anseongensis TaxID=3133439 RepID=UPI0030A3F8B1